MRNEEITHHIMDFWSELGRRDNHQQLFPHRRFSRVSAPPSTFSLLLILIRNLLCSLPSAVKEVSDVLDGATPAPAHGSHLDTTGESRPPKRPLRDSRRVVTGNREFLNTQAPLTQPATRSAWVKNTPASKEQASSAFLLGVIVSFGNVCSFAFDPAHLGAPNTGAQAGNASL